MPVPGTSGSPRKNLFGKDLSLKSWIFVLHGPQINKEKCGMPIVKIELEKYMSEVWEVAGYGSLEEMRKAPTRPLLDCELM